LKTKRSSKTGTKTRGTSGLLRVAVCGCGGRGRDHVLSLLALPEVDVVALADSDHAACARLRDEELVPRGKPVSIFHTLEEQLRLARVDAVVLATPHQLHYGQARAALRAGVHVLVEKPMVTSTRQATALVDLARKQKRVLAIAHQGSCSSELRYIRRLLAEGKLGEITTVDGFISQDWLSRCRGTWRVSRELAGGGMLYDTGSHLLHAVLWLTGLKPVNVGAMVDNRGTEVDVVSSVLVRFDNGAMGTLLANGDARTFSSGLRIVGTRGTVVTGADGGRRAHSAVGRLLKYPPVKDHEMTVQSNFIEAVRGRSEAASPGEWGVKLCRLMDGIYTSAGTGKPAAVRWK